MSDNRLRQFKHKGKDDAVSFLPDIVLCCLPAIKTAFLFGFYSFHSPQELRRRRTEEMVELRKVRLDDF